MMMISLTKTPSKMISLRNKTTSIMILNNKISRKAISIKATSSSSSASFFFSSNSSSIKSVYQFRSMIINSKRRCFSSSSFSSSSSSFSMFSTSSNLQTDQNILNSNNVNITNEATLSRATDTPATTPRTKLRVADVLKGIENRKNFILPQEATIADAMAHLVTEKLSSSLIIDKQSGSIVGIFTARDLLKSICEHSSTIHSSIPSTTPSTPAGGGGGGNGTKATKTPESFHHIQFSKQVIDYMNHTNITEIMTKREKLVYCSPNDSLSHCREIMFQCKIRNLPIIDSDNVVKGILTMKIIADSSFNLIEIGGKKGFIHNVTGRRGLPNTAKVDLNMNENADHIGGKLITKLDMEVGTFALPHPFKSERGAANNARDFGAYTLSTDLKYCEDAHFAIRLKDVQTANPLDVTPISPSSLDGSVDNAQFNLPLAISSEPSEVFICVADGVGSWRQYGVDPREYSHKLVENARKVIETDHMHRAILGHMPFDRELPSIHPLDIILDAWNLTTSEGVQGSSTVCVATLDKKLNQISYSNIGDCGLIVLRHIDSETAGYMRDRSRPRHERKTDLKIAYISQQQLRSFNLPYQLGFSKLAESPQVFETPNDADTASIPVMPGDVIILATDGLYDNLELNEIIEEVYKWEKEYFPSPGEEDLRYPSKKGNEAVQKLAERLVKLARDLSLDPQRDSPFAILAKENDIMWGGGMPDDTTVIVGRIVAINN